MKTKNIIFVFQIMSIISISAKSATITSGDPYFNILSLDGAGMNGIVTAKILSMIEHYAFNYTEDHNIT